VRAATCRESARRCLAFQADEVAALPQRPTVKQVELWAAVLDPSDGLWLTERITAGVGLDVAATLAAFVASGDRAESHRALAARRGWRPIFALTGDLNETPRATRPVLTDEERRARDRERGRARRARLRAAVGVAEATT
jgi:hypothetical protein